MQSRELELAREEVSRLSQEVQAHAEGSGAARDEHQRLREELKSRAMEEAEGGGDGGGIGEGAKRKCVGSFVGGSLNKKWGRSFSLPAIEGLYLVRFCCLWRGE